MAAERLVFVKMFVRSWLKVAEVIFYTVAGRVSLLSRVDIGHNVAVECQGLPSRDGKMYLFQHHTMGIFVHIVDDFDQHIVRFSDILCPVLPYYLVHRNRKKFT